MKDKLTVKVVNHLISHGIKQFSTDSTISEVLKWFRDRNGLYIYCTTHKYGKCGNKKTKWRWELINIVTSHLVETSRGTPSDIPTYDIDREEGTSGWGYVYDSWEEASLGGIEYICTHYKKIWLLKLKEKE